MGAITPSEKALLGGNRGGGVPQADHHQFWSYRRGLETDTSPKRGRVLVERLDDNKNGSDFGGDAQRSLDGVPHKRPTETLRVLLTINGKSTNQSTGDVLRLIALCRLDRLIARD